MKDAQPSHAPTFFRVVYFLLGLQGALLLALLLALWLNWTSSLASSFASLMQATTTSKCFFKASGLAFSPFSRSDLVLFSIFALCQLLKHGLLVLQACLAQGLFFTFFKASSKLLWVLVGISLAFFSFFKPSSKDKGASPSSSSSSPSPLVKAAKFPFLPSALPLPLPLPFSRPLLCLFQGYTA